MYLRISSKDEKVETNATHYISMPIQVYTDLCACIDHYDTEVSGCGMVERIEHRFKSNEKDEADTIEIEFRVNEIYLPGKQNNTRASTNIEDDTISELMCSLLEQGKNTEHLRFHWHSHADMDTFHSGTDNDNYATLSNGDFLISVVINKDHKILGRIDYFKPIRVTISGVGVYMILDTECEPSKEIQESISKLDEYEKGRKLSCLQSDWNDTSLFSRNNDYTDTIYDEEREYARSYYNLTKEQIDKFENCPRNNCDKCKEVTECHNYMSYLY
jgi:hypothetical protein